LSTILFGRTRSADPLQTANCYCALNATLAPIDATSFARHRPCRRAP
jgi:hypothetical protein